MPFPPTSHRLFERTWRSTCPIRPRHSRLRRWGGLLLLVVLGGLIAGYAIITDADRVRRQAETYLARLVGGPVTVGSASLSLFEGLRLERVTVSTPARVGEAAATDAVLFTARSVRIDYNPLDLLLGRLSAKRVIAVDPTVRLVEDVEADAWNFQRLERRRRPAPGMVPPGSPMFALPDALPEILLRNAQVEYARRLGPTLVPRGSVGVEAQLTPAVVGGAWDDPEAGAYRFAMQTRGLASADDPGPQASGTIDLLEGTLDARLQHVDFAALLDMLPRAAGDWWRRHDIVGRLDVTQARFDFDDLVTILGPDGAAETVPQFRVVVELDGAQMEGQPEQWLPAEELAARQLAVRGLEALRARVPEAERDGPHAAALARLIDQGTPKPVRLRDVSGSFVFSETGVRVNGLLGEFEGHRLRVDGIVNGYHRDAGVSLVVRNADDYLTLPARLPYVASLPRQVREVYDRFLPNGRCRLRLELHRPEPSPDGVAGRPVVTGHVDVLDGTFTLDRFPYPIRHARGRLLLRYDRATQQDQLLIEDLRGRGVAGGPNADALLTVSGAVGPLTSVAGFDIVVSGQNVRDEPALIEALPKEARQTIANFDFSRHGKGAGLNGGPPPALSFGGDFQAHIRRPAGRNQRWDFRVDLALKDVSGAFVGFPYPLDGADADVSVFRDHVAITRAHMRRPVGEDGTQFGELDFRGRVDWGRRATDPPTGPMPPLRVDLSVTGANLPADSALLAALPPESARQLRALGVGGRADVGARVFTDANDRMSWDVTLDLRAGRFWPETGTFSLTDAAGRLRILPDRVLLTDVTGRRGEGTVTVNGAVGLDVDGITDAVVLARGVTLDTGVYELLPRAAKDAWDWLRPSGATDAEIAFRGPTAVLLGGGDVDPATVAYDITLRPQGMAVLPQGFPYPMQSVRGAIRVTPGRVELMDVSAVHALSGEREPVRLAIAGVGELGSGEDGADVWSLRPRAAGAPVDEELLAALPEGLAETIRSLQVAGTLDADFAALRITIGSQPRVEGEPALSAQPQDDSGAMTRPSFPPDIAFDVTLATADASADVGVALSSLNGSLRLAGTYAEGKLREVSGSFDAASFAVSGRAGTGLKGTVSLPPGSRVLTIDNLAAQVAGGQLGGGVILTFGEEDEDATRYALAMAVREADVRQLVGERDGRPADFGGRLTARLDVEGAFGDVASRRGRGEVVVQGEKLYDLPLVLGLLQVTNLAMPVAEPFREATTRFTVDGPQIVFDAITLRAADMTMNGAGTLSFATQRVDLEFTTTSHRWAQVPLLGDIMGLARNELLRIHVRGTLQSPEVSGSTLPTITGTIDEVFRRK